MAWNNSNLLVYCTMLGIAIGGVTNQMMYGLCGGVLVGVLVQTIFTKR